MNVFYANTNAMRNIGFMKKQLVKMMVVINVLNLEMSMVAMKEKEKMVVQMAHQQI